MSGAKFKVMRGVGGKPARVFLESGVELPRATLLQLQSAPEWDVLAVSKIDGPLTPPARWVPDKLVMEFRGPEIEFIDSPPHE